jgi:exopolyphosphatase
MTSLPSLSEFLKTVTLKDFSKVTLGNPAGDADSIVGAIALAYIDGNSVPIISIPHQDLSTQRPETKYLLTNLAKIELLDLTAIDNETLPESTNVSLVDHNVLTLDRKWEVRSILDHHLDEEHHMDTCDERIIAFDKKTSTALVASSCTLMTERFLSLYPKQDFPPSLAILLLGVILIDSVNLNQKAGKVTPRDEEAVQALMQHTDWSALDLPSELLNESLPDCTKIFDTLQSQKFHPNFWNGLSVKQALKLDYKSFSSGDKAFGISSVLQAMPDFMQRAQILESIQKEQLLQGLEFLAIMHFSIVDDTPMRQITLIAANRDLLELILHFMKAEGSLQVEEVDYHQKHDTSLHMICLDQENSKASRKQVAPLLMEFFKQQASKL